MSPQLPEELGIDWSQFAIMGTMIPPRDPEEEDRDEEEDREEDDREDEPPVVREPDEE